MSRVALPALPCCELGRGVAVLFPCALDGRNWEDQVGASTGFAKGIQAMKLTLLQALTEEEAEALRKDGALVLPASIVFGVLTGIVGAVGVIWWLASS